MKRVFVIFSEAIAYPLTIVASGYEEARNIFAEWFEANCDGGDPREPKVTQLSLMQTAMQPQHADLARQGLSGVAYWLGHRAGWILAASQEPRKGQIAPPLCDVRCFVFTDEQEELLVFAPTVEAAHSIHVEWNLSNYGERGEFTGAQEVPRWLLQGPQVTLREDMDAGLTGVGSVSEDGLWHIFPADYEPELSR
jgi:hypothetical protein